MPNWTSNIIAAKGLKKLDIFDADGNLDFNKIIPEPRTKEECPEGYIAKPEDHISLLENKPWFSWYKWHCDFWGTKWNAVDTYVTVHNDKDVIEFDTAWCPPIPISELLGNKLPSFLLQPPLLDNKGLLLTSLTRCPQALGSAGSQPTI